MEDSLGWSAWDPRGMTPRPIVRGTAAGAPPPPPPLHHTTPHHTTPHHTTPHHTTPHHTTPHHTTPHHTTPHHTTPHHTTPHHTTMAGVAQNGHEAYRTHVASGVGTSQEGETMILMLYIRRLAQQPQVFWLVPNSEAAVGALRTYHEGSDCGDGIHHLYATVLGGRRLSPASAINMVTTLSHWITDLNVRVDAATQEPLEVDPAWLLHRPFSFLPPVTYRDQCHLSPTARSDWL